MVYKQTALFSIGDTVHHRLFGYRGVIVDVDPCFQASEEWYERMARTLPPKDSPWYHVCVHLTGVQTYVAEKNIEIDDPQRPVDHPLIGVFFTDFKDGVYLPRQPLN